MSRIVSLRVDFTRRLQWTCGRAARRSTVAASEESASEGKPFSAIPGPGNPLTSTLSVFRSRHRLHEFFRDRHAQYGPIYKERMGQSQMLFIADPEGAQQVLRQQGKYPSRPELTVLKASQAQRSEGLGVGNLEGEEWYRVRRVVNQPLMRVKSVAQHLGDFHDVAEEFMHILARKRDPQGVVPNLEDELLMWSLESISNMLFNKRLGCLKEQLERDVEKFIDATQYLLRAMNILIFLPTKFVKIALPLTWKKFVHEQNVIMDYSRKCIDEKVEELAARGEQEEREMGIIESLLTQSDLTRNEVYANVTDFMAGGIDTTSHSTVYILHQLAAHPQVQQRLYDDVIAVLPPGQPPTFERLQQLPLLKAVIKETMRLYPVAISLAKLLFDDAVILGYHVPKKTPISISLYTMNMDDSIYQDPRQFKPERWLRGQDEKEDIHPFAYLPFGMGPRMCIGRRVAEMEMQVLVTEILRRFRLEPVDSEPLRMKSAFLTVPAKPVRLRLVSR